jgi:hypothetical protein
VHRDVLLFDARQTVQSRLQGSNRKRHAKPSNQTNPFGGRANFGIVETFEPPISAHCCAKKIASA